MLDPEVEIALFGGITAVAVALSASVQTLIAGWQAQRRQRDDWARQDLVVQRTEKAASDLLESNKQIAIQAQNFSTAAISASMDVAVKLNDVKEVVISTKELAVTTHALVNSNLTFSQQQVFDGLLREMILLRRLPNVTDEEIEQQQARINEQRTILNDRASATDFMLSKSE
jgi:hypothetical protein